MSNAKFDAKGVTDAVPYDIKADKPVIQFDSLKTSSVSVASEKVYVRGGKDNPKLITWGTNREVTLIIEDTLISSKSMEFVSGIARKVGAQTIRMRRTTEYESGENKGKMYPLKTDATGKVALTLVPSTDVSKILVYPLDSGCEEDALFDMTGTTLGRENKTLTIEATKDQRVVVYYDYDSEAVVETHVVGTEHLGGTCKLVDDAVLRSQKTDKDEASQVTTPDPELTSNLEPGFAAEDDPSTTAFEYKVMHDIDAGTMIQVVKY